MNTKQNTHIFRNSGALTALKKHKAH